MKQISAVLAAVLLLNSTVGCMEDAAAIGPEEPTQIAAAVRQDDDGPTGEAQQRMDPWGIGLLIVGAIAAGAGLAAVLLQSGHGGRGGFDEYGGHHRAPDGGRDDGGRDTVCPPPSSVPSPI